VGNPADVAELSFKKGEILDIFDRSGKWWEVRKVDGSKGSEWCFLSFFLCFV
jgi:SHO1 osmosensor